MKNDREGEPNYVRKVQEDTRQYIQGLLRENEALRTMVARQESERLRLEEQVLHVRHELDLHRKEQIRLQRQIVEIETENQRFAREYAAIEQHNTNLANLYVASYRLHGTLDRETVLAVIQEIIINLVGSEQIGIFEVAPERDELSLIASCGIDSGRYARVRLDEGLIGSVAGTGRPFFRGESGEAATACGDEQDLSACIALHVDGRVTGAIAVFRLLPQKAGLEALDRELFDLLATHAATALHAAELHSTLAAGAEASR